MKQLIVNADDFGMTEGVNRAILEAHRGGIVTSTSLLANGAAFASAVELARQTPSLGVGVHLNLTEGRPVSGADGVPGLTSSTGEFFAGSGRLMMRMLRRRATAGEVEREFRAQIEKVLAAGVTPTHLDGHQHVHMWPPVFEVTARLAGEYGIGGVRCSRERHAGLTGIFGRNGSSRSKIARQWGGGVALALLAVGARSRLEREGVAAPDYFYGVSATGFLDRAAVEAVLRDLPEGTSELMCHPGYADAALEAVPTRLRRERETELAALTGPEIRNLVREMGIELITYRGLPVPGKQAGKDSSER
jgi:hopanoid biosynthesis associated protein HpnK